MNPRRTGVRKSYKPGEIIQDKCTPIFQIIEAFSTERGKVCDSCFELVSPKSHVSHVQACSGCKKMYYCSKACQKADWKNGHKLECKSKTWNKTFEDLDENDRFFLELRCQLFRSLAFLKFNQDIANKPFTMYDGSTQSFNELLALQKIPETKELEETPKLQDFCAKFATEISEEALDTGDILADTEFFMKILQIIMSSNAIREKHNALNGKTVTIGMSIYVERPFVKHSCKPTAMFCNSPDGKFLQLKAIAPINEGEKPTMTYTYTNVPKEMRQEMLKTLYYFDCTCQRCTTDEDATVDFGKFNSHANFFKSCTLHNNNWMTVSVGEFFARHEQMVEWMKKMYHEYDTPVTKHYSLVYHGLVFTYADVADGIMDSPKAKALYEDTKQHVLTTFGKDHPEYNKLTTTMGLLEMVKMMNNPNGPSCVEIPI